MKKKYLFIAVLLGTLTLSAFKLADDILSKLGMDQSNAQYHILRNLVGRFSTGAVDNNEPDDNNPLSVYNQLQHFKIPYARLLPSILQGDKTGASKELCVYVKTYFSSEAFAKAYADLREDAMPLSDEGASLYTLRKNKIVFEKNIKNYITDTKYVVEQQQKLNENQKKMDALTEASKKPFPNKEIWEKTYPADPALLIKKRLQEYLTLAATVDFKATLTGSGKKQVFTNPAYEKKSLKWKAIYRAGKEVNDAVTAFVKEWMK